MEMILKAHPSCHNCENFVHERKGFHCKARVGGVHPENCGHLMRKILPSVAVYELDCEKYSPKQVQLVAAELLEVLSELETLKERVKVLEGK